MYRFYLFLCWVSELPRLSETVTTLGRERCGAGWTRQKKANLECVIQMKVEERRRQGFRG